MYMYIYLKEMHTCLLNDLSIMHYVQFGSNILYHNIRKLFDLPYRTHCDLLPYICDDCPPNEQFLFSCYISM